MSDRDSAPSASASAERAISPEVADIFVANQREDAFVRGMSRLDANKVENGEESIVANEGTAMETSLELAELKERMETASRSVGVARSEGVLPHLSGGFHAERDERLWEIGGHLTIGIPIFDRAQGRQHSARAEFASLRERDVAAANAVRATHRVALTRVESTTRRARHYRDQVIPAREKALQAAVRQYNAVQTSVFALLKVQREVSNAASSYVDTLVELWKARAALVVHPRRPRGPRVDRDFVLMTHEWFIRPGTRRPDPNKMSDFNLLTFNSKAFPATEPLVMGRGERQHFGDDLVDATLAATARQPRRRRILGGQLEG